MAEAELIEPTELFESEPVESERVVPDEEQLGVDEVQPAEEFNTELAVVRNELTSALHEAHYQRRKRADAVQLLAYERLVRRSRVSGTLWFTAALALVAVATWSLFRSTESYDLWQICAAASGALAIVFIVIAILVWAGPSRAQLSLSLRQVRRLTPPEMLSEAWFHAAHEVGTPREYRRAFHGLV